MVLPPYDDALLSRELALFPDWYVKGKTPRHRDRNDTLRGKLETPCLRRSRDSNLNSLGGARVYVHRDFMPRNLMVMGTSNVEGVQFSDGPPLGKLAPLQDERAAQRRRLTQ